ncbi:MAG: hypothetical protein ACAI44_16080 [Candidatus Sericytochromatia bacterium]
MPYVPIRLTTGLLGLSLLLAACQPQNLAPAVRAQSRASLSRSEILSYYPLEAGRSWTFALEQTQNGQDNTKFKTLTMFTEPLAPEAGAERAVLRRVYPDSTVTPTPSLARRFGDRVELSRYQAPADTGFLALQPPSGAVLPAARGAGFIIAMQLPFEPGHSWGGREFQGGSETISVRGEETVSVPAGTFKALLIEHHLSYDNGKEDYLRYWYAPGVGMVKMYEELTAYFGQWLKFRSTGVLSKYTLPNTTARP